MGARIVTQPDSKIRRGYREVLVIGLPKDEGKRAALPRDIAERLRAEGSIRGRRIG